jgi:hypothetical protein
MPSPDFSHLFLLSLPPPEALVRVDSLVLRVLNLENVLFPLVLLETSDGGMLFAILCGLSFAPFLEAPDIGGDIFVVFGRYRLRFALFLLDGQDQGLNASVVLSVLYMLNIALFGTIE